ncbi:MAG TPA: YoaP domain-containing protein [Thermoclostridium sp.]|nr:YoaP domain-containing protein [Thermoclostridium sp.]
MEVDSPEKARTVPGVFNNYAAFYKVRFLTLQPLNEGGLKKVLAQIL